MNMLDSELVVAALRKAGYEVVDSPGKADTILFNTCSVRQHAEDKIYSALGRLKHAKRHNPHKIIGVLGCMAQKDQKLIFERAPFVDLVVGPGQLHQIPELLERVAAGAGQQLEVSLDRTGGSRAEIEQSFESYDPLRDPAMRPTPFQAFVRIMIGCDKFCTYCIVPSVRGPEQSRPSEHIEAEARQLAAEGCREITLLGQTVNSYRHESGGRTTRLSDLLERLHGIEGIERLKFVTNYPADMTDDLLAAVRDLPKVSPYLHVPAQSGANSVLRRMKRGYTVEEYRHMLERIRQNVPESSVTSDFIVGFPGETDDEFDQTVELVRDVAIQEQLHLQVFRAPRHQERTAFSRRCSRRGETAPQQRAIGHPERDQRGGQPAIHRPARPRARRRTEQGGTAARRRRSADPAGWAHALRSHHGVRRQSPPGRPTARRRRLRRQRLHPLRQCQHGTRRAGSLQPLGFASLVRLGTPRDGRRSTAPLPR